MRQGCPLSPYLFVLAVELLACKIRQEKEIPGINIFGKELKISQCADDTTLFNSKLQKLKTILDVWNCRSLTLFGRCLITKSLGISQLVHSIEYFHMTSRRPCWCPKTKKWRPCWCPKLNLWELNSIFMRILSFVSVNQYGR